MKPYTELLESLLVMEFNKTPERAKELVKNNPNIVTQGIMHGNQSLRASAMLLDDIDSKAPDASAPNGPGCGADAPEGGSRPHEPVVSRRAVKGD